MFSLKQLLGLFKSLINPITQNNNRLRFFNAAIRSLGTDASPNDIAPDEYGCAETVNDIHKLAFGYAIGGDVSTYRMYRDIKLNKKFVKVEYPLEGDIVISPTGYGSGGLTNGHVGIVGELTKIMSNDSSTGKFEENYTIQSWRERYVIKGGYPMAYFRRV